MITVIKISTLTNVCCKSFFHTSQAKSSQIGRAMGKIMGRTKIKKSFQEIVALPSPEAFSKGAAGGQKNESSRRTQVLNKMFMRHVTDLMATGQYASELTGHGIEISRIKISADYKFLRVYWYTRGLANDDDVGKLLNRNAGYLKHELSQLRVMGNVPNIVFVKDKHYGSAAQVDKLLATADFGEDYVPLNIGTALKNEFQIYAPLEEHIKKKIELLEAENKNQYMAPLPEMTHNIFGVNHASILERVKKSKKPLGPSYSDESSKDWAQFKVTQPINEDPVNFDNDKSRQIAFKDFLHQRQLQRLQNKQNKRYNPDREYMKEESILLSKDNLKIPIDNLEDDEDYIIEDDKK